MFGSRWRKISRDVWTRKSRTAMVSVAIFVGVLGVVTLWSSGDLLVSQLDKDLKEDQLPMQQAFVSAPGGVQLDNGEALQRLEQFPGVTRVEGRAVRPLSWKLPGEPEYEDGFVLSAWDPFEEIELQPLRLTGGHYPVTGQHEIAVEKRMADKYGLRVGDQILLRVPGGSPEGEAWTISGIVFTPYPSFSGAGQAVPSDGSIFATFEDAQAIGGFAGFSVFYVRYTDFPTARAQADAFYASIAQETPYVPVFNFVDDPGKNYFITQAGEITGFITTLGVLAMIVSGLLVVNVINSIVGEQRRQIGVMKSLGATRWDNFVIYVGVAMTYGVMGTVPGVVIGSYAGFLMAQALDESLFTYIDGFTISSAGIIIGAMMGLAIPFLAAIVPVFLGTRVTILEALTDVGISGSYGTGIMARVIHALPLPTNTRQAVTNVTRKKGRLTLTWLTLMLAVAAFMGIFGVFVSINSKIGDVFDAFGFDITVVPNERQDFEQARALVSERVDGVAAAYPGVSVAVELEGYVEPDFGTSQLQMVGFDPATDSLNLDIQSGTAWEDDPTREGVVLSRSVANDLGKTAGDTVVLVARGQSTETEIIGVASFPFDQGFMRWQTLAKLIGSTDSEGQPVPTSMFVQMTEPDPSVAQVDVIIDDIDKVLLSNGIAATQVNQVEAAKEITDLIATFGLTFESAAIVMAVVGAIGLLSTLSLSVFERLREIGVMRSIGASSFTVASQFLTEGMLVGISAWIIAVPLSFLVAGGLISSLGLDEFIEGVGYGPIALLIGLIGIIVITALASLGPSMSAARRTVSEILRYQ
jgi:putative ABC transport system permease protein